MKSALAHEAIRLTSRPENTTVDVVLHPGSRGAHGFVTFFFYDAGEPFCVAKVPRVDPDAIDNEANNLATVAKMLEHSTLQTRVERTLGTVEVAGRRALFKHLCTGQPAAQLAASGDTEGVITALRLGADWMLQFIEDTSAHHRFDAETKRLIAAGLVTGSPNPDWFDTFISSPHQFVGPTHGDLVPANILVNDGAVSAVVDFENFQTQGLPLADLAGLIVSLGTTAFGRDETMIDTTFRSVTPFSTEVATHTQRYCDLVGCTVEEVVNLLPMYSDRSLAIASAWGLTKEHEFHTRLRRALIADAAKITTVLGSSQRNQTP